MTQTGWDNPALAALAAEMARHGKDREAPVRSTMALLGDRWTTLIVLVLAAGALRHAELRRVLAALSAEAAISQRVLTLKLRALERDGFVGRTVSDDVPPKVTYRLTLLGQELHRLARVAIDWAQDNGALIAAARRRFDRG
jgi:DNA-binding HxlR family transcriptional regulator